MAISTLSLQLLRNFAPLGVQNSDSSNPLMAVPLLPAALNCSQRCKFNSYSSRFRGVSVNYGARTRAMVRDTEEKIEDENHSLIGDDSSDNNQITSILPKVHERDFTNTPYVPVYVMLPLGTISMEGELVDPDVLINQLRILKSINVDGVMVDCWWGIVEAHAPQQYNWSAYRRLFQIVRDLKLKLQVVMSFHECGGNIGDDAHIPLPQWVLDVGSTNPDIFFTDREGRRNRECLTWGIDKERVLRGRTAVEVHHFAINAPIVFSLFTPS